MRKLIDSVSYEKIQLSHTNSKSLSDVINVVTLSDIDFRSWDGTFNYFNNTCDLSWSHEYILNESFSRDCGTKIVYLKRLIVLVLTFLACWIKKFDWDRLAERVTFLVLIDEGMVNLTSDMTNYSFLFIDLILFYVNSNLKYKYLNQLSILIKIIYLWRVDMFKNEWKSYVKYII